MGGVIALMLLLCVYFAPAIVAGERRHNSKLAVFMLNLLLGWTALGWIAALVWAYAGDVKQRAPSGFKRRRFLPDSMQPRQQAQATPSVAPPSPAIARPQSPIVLPDPPKVLALEDPIYRREGGGDFESLVRETWARAEAHVGPIALNIDGQPCHLVSFSSRPAGSCYVNVIQDGREKTFVAGRHDWTDEAGEVDVEGWGKEHLAARRGRSKRSERAHG